MCNIAGYVGNKQAAPILLKMLRRQQAFDGDMSTGIATIHEGKLLWRKVVGDVDTLIRETDVLSLPGTIGIAHTRPMGNPEEYELAHPYLSMDGEMAMVSNGTTPLDQYAPGREAALQMLEENGYEFRAVFDKPNSSWPRLKSGLCVGAAEVRVHLIDYYLKQGKSYGEAMAIALAQLYADNVGVILNVNQPDRIFALRTTRPMNVLLSGEETYLATTGFGFPEDVRGTRMSLPVMRVCEMTKGRITMTEHTMNAEPICEITPYAYSEAYQRIVKMLTGKKDSPLYFEELEIEITENMKDIWPEQHTYVQGARLAYEILEQLQSEGRLKREIRKQTCDWGLRDREYMWIE